MLNRVKKRHIVILGLLCALATVSIIYLQNDQENDSVVLRAYDSDKDFRPLVKLINDNMFFMSETPDFSPERMLTLRAPNNDPSKKNQVNIMVVEAEETTAGFISYYKKNFEHGYIWQLVVDKNFRGRHFGEKLVSSALSHLKRMGAKYVTLVTRLINEPALGLYKKMGFVEKERIEDRGLIILIKKEL